MKAVWLALTMMAGFAQAQTVGSVAAQDANVTTGGHLAEVVHSQAMLVGSSSVTAKDHNADVKLTRGGNVLLCRTSGLHVAGSGESLVLGLDRGAMEIRMKAAASDAILTPDLRITMAAAGPLDLQMRVSTNGDTCIDNRGKKAPSLNLTDAFGQASYLLKPGQHVLFEHGSLREVVDRETTPCGCPPEDPRPVPLNDAQVNGSVPVTPQQAAAAHPFPTAQSEGLAPPPNPPASRPGETKTQVSTTFAFDPNKDVPPPPAASQPAAQEQKGGAFHSVGRFFKRIFVR